MNVSVKQVTDSIWEFCKDENISPDEVARKVGIPLRAASLVFMYGHLPPEKLARALSQIGLRTAPDKVDNIMRAVSPESWKEEKAVRLRLGRKA